MSIVPGVYRIRSTCNGGYIGVSSENLEIVMQGINIDEGDDGNSQKVSYLQKSCFGELPISFLSGLSNHKAVNGP